MVVVVHPEGVLRMGVYRGQGTSGGIAGIHPDAYSQVQRAVLRRVRRKLHADHSRAPPLVLRLPCDDGIAKRSHTHTRSPRLLPIPAKKDNCFFN